jgi:hypothetical protein
VELGGVFGQCDKDALRHVFRQMRITNHAARCGINEINVPPDQFGEGGFRTCPRIGAQQLRISLIVHSLHVSRHRKNRTGKEFGPEKQKTAGVSPGGFESILLSVNQ